MEGNPSIVSLLSMANVFEIIVAVPFPLSVKPLFVFVAATVAAASVNIPNVPLVASFVFSVP